MGDILKPNTSESKLETARRRRIPTIGNASSSTVPASAPLSVEQQQQQPAPPPLPSPPTTPAPVVEQPVVEGTTTATPAEQPTPDTQQLIPDPQQPIVEEGTEPGVPLQVEPVPPTLQEQQVVPSVFASPTPQTEAGGGFQVEEPRQPDANFGDILTAPTLQPIYQGSAETQRRAQADQQRLAFDTQKFQAEMEKDAQERDAKVAMNAENNLTQERIKTAELTVDEVKLRKEQEDTAIKLNQSTQRNLGA